MMKLKYILCALALGYLSACTNELIAGSTYSPDDKNIYVDAIGSQARFGTIVAIGVDSQDNVYVADQGNGRIRKIAPNRQVSTLAGTNQVQTQFPEQADPLKTQLVDLGGLTVYDDTLYFTVKGCIRSVDLKQREAERKINTFYGKCLSEQEKEKAAQDYLDQGTEPEYLRKIGELQHDVNGNLYVVALPREVKELNPDYNKNRDAFTPTPYEPQYIHKIDKNKSIHREMILDTIIRAFTIDYDGMIVQNYITSAPFPHSKLSYKYFANQTDLFDFVDQHKEFLDEPETVLFGKNKTAYVFANWFAKKESNGQISLISDIPRLEGHLHVLNPSETVLYSASYSQVYKLNLPK